MHQRRELRHAFVDEIPESLAEATIYVCVQYATVVHKCCCGCGLEVVTPLSPTDWRLIFDGCTVSLDPSIGNWRFDCQSHYWIRHNMVVWAPKWSKEQIAVGRTHDALTKRRYFETLGGRDDGGSTKGGECRPPLGKWARFKKWWRSAG